MKNLNTINWEEEKVRENPKKKKGGKMEKHPLIGKKVKILRKEFAGKTGEVVEINPKKEAKVVINGMTFRVRVDEIKPTLAKTPVEPLEVEVKSEEFQTKAEKTKPEEKEAEFEGVLSAEKLEEKKKWLKEKAQSYAELLSEIDSKIALLESDPEFQLYSLGAKVQLDKLYSLRNQIFQQALKEGVAEEGIKFSTFILKIRKIREKYLPSPEAQPLIDEGREREMMEREMILNLLEEASEEFKKIERIPPESGRGKDHVIYFEDRAYRTVFIEVPDPEFIGKTKLVLTGGAKAVETELRKTIEAYRARRDYRRRVTLEERLKEFEKYPRVEVLELELLLRNPTYLYLYYPEEKGRRGSSHDLIKPDKVTLKAGMTLDVIRPVEAVGAHASLFSRLAEKKRYIPVSHLQRRRFQPPAWLSAEEKKDLRAFFAILMAKMPKEEVPKEEMEKEPTEALAEPSIETTNETTKES